MSAILTVKLTIVHVGKYVREFTRGLTTGRLITCKN